MPRKTSQYKRDTYCMTCLSQIYRQKAERWLPGAGRKKRWAIRVQSVTEFQLKKMTWFWRGIVEVITQQYECTECHEAAHLKMLEMVKFVVYIFCQNKKRKKITSFRCSTDLSNFSKQCNIATNQFQNILIAAVRISDAHLPLILTSSSIAKQSLNALSFFF